MAFFSLQIGQYAAQVLVHSALAVLIVEALLKLWRIEAPRIRVHFRILFLVLPLVGWPVFQLLWPTRGSLEFRGTLAIFDIQQWLPLRVAGVPGWGWVVVAAGLGAALFLGRAVLPTGHRYLAGRSGVATTLAGTLACRLRRSLTAAGDRVGGNARVVADESAVAYLRGVRRPRLVVSGRLVELLDEDELRAVLAHEEAHLLRRDNLTGWGLLLAGLLVFYNPVALVALQRATEDMEMACDDAAVESTGEPLALATALIKTGRYNAAGAAPGGRRPLDWLPRLHARVSRTLVGRRVRRLIDRPTPGNLPLARVKLSMAVALTGALLFFVV